jgi:predicted Zn-dependent peptidase
VAAAACAAWLGAAGPAPAATGLENLEKQVQEFQLENGVRFLLVRRSQAPVFSFQTVVNAGAANDQIGTTGIAHMMEHMAFKGTARVGTRNAKEEEKALAEEEKAWNALLAERRKGARADSTKLRQLEAAFEQAKEKAEGYVVSNAFGRLLEENGSQGLNAFTASDITAYQYSLPSNRLELWALLEGSRMAFPVFREFYTERDVVFEERRMRVESSPIGRLFNEFLHTAYVAHPYGIGGIGYASDLTTFTRTEGEEFYRTYYVGPNMAVAVVGDVRLEDLERYAKKYWSDVPSGPLPAGIDTVEPEQKSERRVIQVDPSQPVLVIAWHIPAATDPSYRVYEALASVLGGGDYARLHKRLVKEKKMAVQAQAFAGLPGNKYPSLLGVFVVPAAGQDPVEVEKEVYALLEEIQTTAPFTQEEVDGWRVRERAQTISACEDNSDLALQLASHEMIFGDWREFFRQQERAQAVTADQVMAAMKERLTRMNRTVGMIVNSEEDAASGGGK